MRWTYVCGWYCDCDAELAEHCRSIGAVVKHRTAAVVPIYLDEMWTVLYADSEKKLCWWGTSQLYSIYILNKENGFEREAIVVMTMELGEMCMSMVFGK